MSSCSTGDVNCWSRSWAWKARPVKATCVSVGMCMGMHCVRVCTCVRVGTCMDIVWGCVLVWGWGPVWVCIVWECVCVWMWGRVHEYAWWSVYMCEWAHTRNGKISKFRKVSLQQHKTTAPRIPNMIKQPYITWPMINKLHVRACLCIMYVDNTNAQVSV